MAPPMPRKVCLVTGAGRGIGAAVAREMHARGHALVLMSPSENCQTLAAELGGVAHRGVAQNADDDTEFAIQGKTQGPGRPVQTPRLKYHGDRRKTEMAKEKARDWVFLKKEPV